MSLLLLAVVYAVVYGFLFCFESRRKIAARLVITPTAMLMAVVMAVTVFAVSNLSFVSGDEVTIVVFYIRTLVDFAGVLILSVQHEQLREAALHSELAAMDNVLHRQYEQYKQSKENIRLINRRYHELKMQIAAIRAERDKVKQDAALAEMESNIYRYEAENKTGNPVLDTLLTAKSMYCQQHGIQPDLRGRRHPAGFSVNRGDMHHRRHGAGQCHRECADRAGPRKAADSRGRLRPERLCDAAV